MKRWGLRICVFLLLGAIVNVVVAWVGFWATDGQGFQRMVFFDRWVETTGRARSLWARHASDGWPEAADRFRSWHGWFASGWSMGLLVGGSYVIRRDATDVELRETFRGSGSFEVEQFDCGFPFGSMRLERWSGSPHARWFKATTGDDGLSLGGQALPRRVLPVRFAINTLFYAGVLWLLFAAPFALRRRRRIKRGLCPACGYQIGTSEVCTECGKPVTPKAVRG